MLPIILSLFAADVQSVLKSMQKAWDETKSYQAEFQQTVTSKQLKTKDESSGTLSVVKPLKMRWESTTDNTVEILSGDTLYQITENKRRKSRTVNIYKNVTQKGEAKIFKFLAGTNKFSELYKATLTNEDKNSYQIKLIDKTRASEVYLAEIDRKSYVLRALTTESVDSTVAVKFSNIRTNASIEKRTFEYEKQPRDVVHEQ